MSTPEIYTKEIIGAICHPIAVGMSDTLVDAALILERFHGTGDGHGGSPRAEAALINDELATRLRDSLIEFVEQRPDHPDVSTAIFALARCGDNSLRPFFLRQMKRFYEAGLYHPTSQAEYGLTVLGDGVEYKYVPGQIDHSGYFAAVRDYLSAHQDEIGT